MMIMIKIIKFVLNISPSKNFFYRPQYIFLIISGNLFLYVYVQHRNKHHFYERMIYTLEKKTQRERLNERLRSSIDSTQFRIRNVTFFFKFTIFSTAKSHFFVNIFKKLIHVFIFFSNFFALNRWFKDFSATFFLSTVFIFFRNFFAFNRWF